MHAQQRTPANVWLLNHDALRRSCDSSFARFAAQNSSHFPNKMTRYIQLAALLPSKSIRDVALRVVQIESIPKVSQSAASNITLPEGIDVVDLRHHEWLNQLLTSNVTLINQMRDNLVQKQARLICSHYTQFRKQVKIILEFSEQLAHSIA